MTRALLATVGTSVTGAFNTLGRALAEGSSPTGDAVAGAVDDPQGVLDVVFERIPANVVDLIASGVGLANESTRDSWSAEISALHAADAWPGDDVPVTLISSDNDLGLVAAMLVGVLLDAPIRVVDGARLEDHPHHSLADLPGLDITTPFSPTRSAVTTVVRVDSLDPASDEAYALALTELSSLLDLVARSVSAAGDHLDVTLNGGYKSTLPLMHLLLQFTARRLASTGGTMRSFLKHEHGSVPVEAPLMPGLVSAATVRTLGVLLDHGWEFEAERLPCETLDGIGWTVEDGVKRATRTGMALARVLHGVPDG